MRGVRVSARAKQGNKNAAGGPRPCRRAPRRGRVGASPAPRSPDEKKKPLPQVLDPVVLKDGSPRFEPFDVLGRGQELGDEAAELGAGRGV